MEYVKIIALINQIQAVESAKALSAAGVDELHFIYETEKDIETIKAVTKAVDTPVSVRMSPNRFEDVKKVLYAGASMVCLMTEKDEVIREVIGRFGEEKIHGMLNGFYVENILEYAKNMKEYGYGQIYMALQGELGEQLDLIKQVGQELPMNIYIPDGMTDVVVIANLVKASEAKGVLLPEDMGMKCHEIKEIFGKEGVAVNRFESSIPFSAFKLNGDGLIPVVVQEWKTNEVLMMAYMNEESYQKTIETGLMTYYSRSRQELWVKGETSGHYQYVKSLSIDCDQDTILAKVQQEGAACHTGNHSCFYRDLVKKEYKDENPLTILQEDYDVIAKRKVEPKEGSYTNYLFDKGIDKILKKVGEEATEIVIAAKNPDAEELKYELADFLYHAMVLMVECGLTWEDVTKELADRR